MKPSPNRPYRCGILQRVQLKKNREQTGGTFYGIMEMTGNLHERTVSIDYLDGRTFDGTHGDGNPNNGYPWLNVVTNIFIDKVVIISYCLSSKFSHYFKFLWKIK